MACIGDRVAGIDKTAECYRKGECGELGCGKCQIKCTGCENCAHLGNIALRKPEVSDFVVVKLGVFDPTYKGPAWTPAMDLAVGRVAWVASGDPINGYHLRFQTTSNETLDQFVYPLSSLKLAMPEDVKTNAMIKEVKKGGNEEMWVKRG